MPTGDVSMTAGDSELVAAAQQGDRAAFAALVERYQGLVYGYLRARLLQASDADDLAQEVFLRSYSARARFDSSAMVGPWLIGIARNLLYEHARKTRRRREVAWTEICLELEEQAGLQEPDEMAAHLPACLESLGESARQAIELFYRGKMRLAEIGTRLRRSEGAAKVLMFRARQALKTCLETKRGRSS
ncbi:MAG TPA: RNA polymerase sigma factor [Pirellulales bacterium]|jgi:RNA polymerase sigma-70 factor (ECF subfamily)|nr:RNA polymerase sigma factor [Pirellulales bacterium]